LKAINEKGFSYKRKNNIQTAGFARGTKFFRETKRTHMAIAIVLFLVVLAGFVMFGYRMNRKKSATKEDAMKSGEEIRNDPGK
jgi:hypothetical protein